EGSFLVGPTRATSESISRCPLKRLRARPSRSLQRSNGSGESSAIRGGGGPFRGAQIPVGVTCQRPPRFWENCISPVPLRRPARPRLERGGRPRRCAGRGSPRLLFDDAEIRAEHANPKAGRREFGPGALGPEVAAEEPLDAASPADPPSGRVLPVRIVGERGR